MHSEMKEKLHHLEAETQAMKAAMHAAASEHAAAQQTTRIANSSTALACLIDDLPYT